MILYVENPWLQTRKLVKILSLAKLSDTKSTLKDHFLCTYSEQSKNSKLQNMC